MPAFATALRRRWLCHHYCQPVLIADFSFYGCLSWTGQCIVLPRIDTYSGSTFAFFFFSVSPAPKTSTHGLGDSTIMLFHEALLLTVALTSLSPRRTVPGDSFIPIECTGLHHDPHHPEAAGLIG